MKVFIFGAGATAGSFLGKLGPGAPLVNDLFKDPWMSGYSQLITKDNNYQMAVEIFSSEDKRLLKNVSDVEDWLTKKWNESPLWVEARRKSEEAFFGRITFYIWNLMQKISREFNGENAYQVLVKRLNEFNVNYGFISFNYDTLLDQAVSINGGNLLNFSDYRKNRLIKPHGSINWFLDRRNTDPYVNQENVFDIRVRYNMASNSMFNDVKQNAYLTQSIYHPFHRDLDDISHIFLKNGGHFACPLLFFPMTSKLHEIHKFFVGEIITPGIELIQKATSVFLIGYQAKDELVIEMLKNVNPETRLYVVDRDSGQAKSIADRVMARVPNLKYLSLTDKGFLNFSNGFEIKKETGELVFDHQSAP